MYQKSVEERNIENTIISSVTRNNNEIDINLIHEIEKFGPEYYDSFLFMLRPLSNGNEIYTLLAVTEESYILKFRDVESIEIVLKRRHMSLLPSYSFNYNIEETVTVNGHELNIVYLLNSPFTPLNSIFIIDAETRLFLADIDAKNGIYINHILAHILGTKKYGDNGWYSVSKHPEYTLPKSLVPIITKCQVLLDFYNR